MIHDTLRRSARCIKSFLDDGETYGCPGEPQYDELSALVESMEALAIRLESPAPPYGQKL